MSTDNVSALVLHGTVHDGDDARVKGLEAEVRQLRADLAEAKRETAKARAETTAAIGPLRRQLTPLYKALQAVFGELDNFLDDVSGADAAAGVSSQDPRHKAVWDSWKSKLGPSCARVIDALLMHGAMNTTQLAIAIGTSRKPIPNLIYKLNQAGLISKDGGKFSLKSL